MLKETLTMLALYGNLLNMFCCTSWGIAIATYVARYGLIRPGKVDLQFIVKAFLKKHADRRSFFIAKFFNF